MKRDNTQGCGCAILFFGLLAALVVFGVFFNRRCLDLSCRVCPHVTLWEHWTR